MTSENATRSRTTGDNAVAAVLSELKDRYHSRRAIFLRSTGHTDLPDDGQISSFLWSVASLDQRSGAKTACAKKLNS
jgi:hypothetical protein